MITTSMTGRWSHWVVAAHLVLVAIMGLTACRVKPEAAVAHVTVVAEGLIHPLGLAALPDGSLLIAEEGTGEADLSAGVSLMTAEGEIGRLISGFPSGRDAGDLSGVPLVAVSPDKETLYVGNFGAGHLWTLPLIPGEPLKLPDEPYTPEQLGMAMEPLNNVMLTNPFDLTFDADGVPVVSDASGNGVAKENPDGTTRFIHRFAPLPNTNNDNVSIDPVPTGITRVGAEYVVTLLGGCPYPPESGQLVAIDESRHQRTIVEGLNMPIDVAQGEDGTLWVLEFATFTSGASCFTGMGYQQNSGRLSRLNEDGTLETVVSGLNYPGAALPMPDGSLYVSEVFDGRLLKITFGPAGEKVESAFQLPQLEIGAPTYREIGDIDKALAELIQLHGLRPQPGLELREGDTPLAQLGQSLFFDPILSGDQNISCATCHHPVAAMADGRVLPIGTGGMGLGPGRDFVAHVSLGPDARASDQREGSRDPVSGEVVVGNPFIGQFVPRNSPTVLNSALLPAQFWDGRVESYALGQPVTTKEEAVNELGMVDALAVQALFPVTSLHEMAGNTLGDRGPQEIRRKLLARLEGIVAYRDRFAELFGTDDIEVAQVAAAIAAFERRFIFTDAPWDRYLAGEAGALTERQKRGALLFYGGLVPEVNCALCHSGDLFTDMGYHNLLAPQLGPGKGVGENGREDWGRSLVSFDRRDQYSFRTPSLRNVTLTAPYFHSGAYATLEAVIWHHANIWEGAASYDPSVHLPPAHYSSVRPFEPQRQAHSAADELREGLPLSQQDVADLVAFLGALTDPGAVDLSAFIPESVISGLPLDPLPQADQVGGTAGDGVVVGRTSAPDGPVTTGASWRFSDASEEIGLSFRHGAFFANLYQDPAAMMGGGLCWIDYDNDGWLDLYLVNSHAEAEIPYWEGEGAFPQNGLFRNEKGIFSDVSSQTNSDLSMRGNGCVAADFNMDGWMDLHITADGPNALLWNNGDGTFSEGAADAGIATPEWNSTANVADLNLDGWPDLFVGSFIDLDYPVPRPTGAFPGDYYGLPDHLYLNNGLDVGGRVTFTEVTRIAGLEREERALGAIFSDLDGDGDLDLYIANDGQANRLYEYEPWPGGAPADPEGLGFRFAERTQQAEVGDTGSGMGVAGGDYDGDGLFDLFVTNWEAELNAIYRNETADEGFLNFRYSTFRIGIRGLGNNMTGWGTTWADFDHDTDADLLTVNGRVPVTNWETDPELVRLYGNRMAEGFPGEYREWTEQVGLKEIGPFLARGSAVADFDNDGDLDLALNQIGGMAVMLRNDGGGDSGNWLQIGLDGFYPGTVVTVELADGRLLKRESHAGSSYLASEDPRLHFGLGDADRVVELTVRWPDGHQSRLPDVEANQLLNVSPQ
jgi:cytochrome c peroxidase